MRKLKIPTNMFFRKYYYYSKYQNDLSFDEHCQMYDYENCYYSTREIEDVDPDYILPYSDFLRCQKDNNDFNFSSSNLVMYSSERFYKKLDNEYYYYFSNKSENIFSVVMTLLISFCAFLGSKNYFSNFISSCIAIIAFIVALIFFSILNRFLLKRIKEQLYMVEYKYFKKIYNYRKIERNLFLCEKYILSLANTTDSNSEFVSKVYRAIEDARIDSNFAPAPSIFKNYDKILNPPNSSEYRN